MYFQRDYILRMIEMMGELVRKLHEGLAALVTGAELDRIAGQACGMPLTLLARGDPEALTDLLDEPRRFLAAQLLTLKTALEEPAALPEDLVAVRVQTLALLASLTDADYLAPAADEAVRVLPHVLDAAPAPLLVRAARLLEAGGRYAAAEDALYAAADLDANTAERVAFFHRLLALPDADVRVGGLSHAEVAEDLRALERERGNEGDGENGESGESGENGKNA